MLAQDERIGRTLADGRFEVVEWIGTSATMGLLTAIDRRDGSMAELTTAGDVWATIEELTPRLCRDVVGLAAVNYLGAANSDDGWASHCVLMSERIPTGERFEVGERRWTSGEVARLGRGLIRAVRAIHDQGAVLGTLRPEALFFEGERITILARGERLWLMPKPNRTKGATVAPRRQGYQAPEVFFDPRLLDDPEPSADVFSIGVMLSELLLGTFPFERDRYVRLLEAQAMGRHLPLPHTPLGAVLTRAIAPKREARPSLEELASILEQSEVTGGS